MRIVKMDNILTIRLYNHLYASCSTLNFAFLFIIHTEFCILGR